MQAGKVYMEIAKMRTKGWLDDSIRDGLLERRDFAEIEMFIGAKPMIIAASTAIAKELKPAGIDIDADDLAEKVMYSEDDFCQMTFRRVEGQQYADFLNKVLFAVHDQWVKDHATVFRINDVHWQNRLYRFAPAALVGMEYLMEYLFVVGPIFEYIGYSINEYWLDDGYRRAQKRFLRDNLVVDREDLIAKIRDPKFYPMYDKEVQELISEIASSLAEQCFERVATY